LRSPDCRECDGAGVSYSAHAPVTTDCERCGGEGVEICGECQVGAPPARVVASYADTCADGSAYDSQVCLACARRLCGLIEMPEPTRCCGYAPAFPGADWGELQGQSGPDTCEHVIGERRCDSSSIWWWRRGNDSTHDYELVGDPPRYRGGCATELCPACVEANESEAKGAA